jgi:signal peptidase I
MTRPFKTFLSQRLTRPRVLRFWRETIRPLLVILAILMTFRSAVADWNDVPSGSMRPSIVEGDRILVNKLAYDLKLPFTRFRLCRWSEPQRGDIVVFRSPKDGTRMVKRVVGLPGDRLEMRGNRLFISGQPAQYTAADESVLDDLPAQEARNSRFLTEWIDGQGHPIMHSPGLPAPRSFSAIVVPPDHYFLMGDNRDNSKDSRWFGMVPGADIEGRSSRVVISLNPDFYYLPRFSRFFRVLP